MRSRRVRKASARSAGIAASLVAVGLLFAGCAVPVDTTTPSADCTVPAVAAAPMDNGSGGLPLSSTVAESDQSTSTVIDGDDSPQAECTGVAITEYPNVVFSEPVLDDGSTYLIRMDITVPQDVSGPVPVVVYIPGGGFIVSDRGGSIGNRSYLMEHGIAVAAIEYRTIGDGGTYRDGVADVKSAVRFLRANADDYGLDGDSIGLWGESAGAYLATMAGVTQGDESFDVGENLDVSSDVSAVVEEFGASDLTRIAADFDQETQDYYRETPDNFVTTYVLGAGTGETLFDDPVAAAAADPVTYIDGSEPPFLNYHGTDDTLISPSQTLLTHDALVAAGATSTRYLVQGAGHGDTSFMGDPEGGRVWSTVAVLDPLVDFFVENF
jgi:acetyl esterase/lipase